MSTADELSTIGKRVSSLAQRRAWSAKSLQADQKRYRERQAELQRLIKRGEKDVHALGRKELRSKLKSEREFLAQYKRSLKAWSERL